MTSIFAQRIRTAAALMVGLLASSVLALELDFDGDFSETNSANFPVKWYWHDTYPGYVPVATAQVHCVEGQNILHYYGAGGKNGCELQSCTRHSGRGGDIITMTFEAKGTGNLWYTLYRYTARGGWIGSLANESAPLTDVWKTYSRVFTLSESSATNWYFEVALGIEPEADAWVRNVVVTRTLDTTEGIENDDFESARERLGNPSIVQGHVAPGLLTQTSMGRYVTTSECDISASQITLPAANERDFVQSSYRLYDFGDPACSAADIESSFSGEGSNFVFNVHYDANDDYLRCTFDGVGEYTYAKSELPADFTLSISADGYYELMINSLSDSSVVRTSGLAPFLAVGTNGLARSVKLRANAGAEAVVTLDEISTAYATVQHLETGSFPYTAQPLATFDPVAAGWDLAFSDEFDGTEVDTNKWEFSNSDNADLAFVEDGILHIRTEYNPGTNTLRTAGMWSRESSAYGYFEARLKFTTYNGWWAAFWLCTHSCGNPFVDGIEIDIFEDYYMRNPARNTLDHNLHMYGGTLKSWNYNSILPGTHNDWYTIGCKWTPFEMTYYLNGQVITAKSSVSHSPYDTVTFDAFRHGTSICPLHAIVSGQIMRYFYGWHDDDEGEVFPEDYLVDYVRVYAFPGATNGVAPKVSMKIGAGNNYTVTTGAMMDFRVTPEVGSSAAPIKAVHIFDNGYYITTKTNAPYNFTFPLSEAYYSKTRWLNPGRQNKIPEFDGSFHVFCAFAEDEDGNVGHSETVSYMLTSAKPSTPYQGVATDVPGLVRVGYFDEGGEGVAYHDETTANTASTTWRIEDGVDSGSDVIGSVSSGEWINYTINVTTAGWYTIKFRYGSPNHHEQYVKMLLDGTQIAHMPIIGHAANHFGTDTLGEVQVKLPSGKHVFKVVLFGQFNFDRIEFIKLPDPGEVYEWTGEAGDNSWKNNANWKDRIYGWDFPYAGDTAYFPTNATIEGDLAFEEGRLTISNAVNSAVTFEGSISGPVGIDKRGGGDIHLKANNPFTGGFTTLGLKRCGHKEGRPGDSCSVYAYEGGSLGIGKAFLDCDGGSHGSCLHLMKPMTVTNEVQLSADGNQQDNIIYHQAKDATITFLERLTTNERYVDNHDNNACPKAIVFEKGVSWRSWSFCSGAIDYLFNSPSSFETLCIYTDARARLMAGGDRVPIIRLYSRGARVQCEGGNSLWNLSILEFTSDGCFIDLCGNDQIVNNFSSFEHKSEKAKSFGFYSPIDQPATICFSGTSSSQPGFRGQFTGAAGLKWAPNSATKEFVFSNTTFRTAGELCVENGKVRESFGASARFARVNINGSGALELDEGTVFECDELYTNGVRVAEGRYLATGVGSSVVGAGYLAVGASYRFLTVMKTESSTKAETSALKELTNYLYRVTGVMPLVTDESGVPAGPTFYLGSTQFAADQGLDLASLEDEAWRIKSANERAVIIAGGGRRGTLYSVYHYLEDVLGVHWFAPTQDGDYVPEVALDDLPLTGLDLAGAPAMPYRTVYYVPGKWSSEFLARNRANTSDANYGGYSMFGGAGDCHTLYSNLGPSNVIAQLFIDHPDYFPLKDGVRYYDTTRAHSGSQSQLCLTSPGLRQLWVQRLRERIAADVVKANAKGVQPPRYYAIDQNDCYDGFCKCDACQAIVAQEGSNSGLMLDFANYVATELKDEYPDVKFMMMALHSSETPPDYMMASNNVVIRLCDTTSDIIRPWTNEVNSAHYNNLVGWAGHSPAMAMWDYSITYGAIGNRCQPVPSEFTYGADIRALYENKGEGFFIEHEDVIASDFRDLKLWLELKLMESPLLDADELYTRFTELFYGAAAPYVREYRQRLREIALACGRSIGWYASIATQSYILPDNLLEFYDIRSNAVAAVENDALKLRRVEYAFLSLDRMRIVRSLYYNRNAARIEGGERLISKTDAIDRYSRVFSEQRQALGLKAGCSEEKEGLTNLIESVANAIELPTPPEFEDVEEDLILFPAAAGSTSTSYGPIKMVSDPESAAGKAVRVAVADVRATPVPTAPTTYLPQHYGFPFRLALQSLYAGSTASPVVRERFTAETAPSGYRWYLIQEDVQLSQSSYVMPFPGCSILLDGAVSDNSELGQKYDVYASFKGEGSEWWHVGLPKDDMVIYIDQVAVVRKTKHGENTDPYHDAKVVSWCGAGTEGDWNDGANWQGGAKPADGEVAFFTTNVTITSDFSLPDNRLMVSNIAGTVLTLDCRVSGKGGLDKRGDGELKLMRDNDFAGAFTSRGTIDAASSTKISSPVSIYSGGALGTKAAYFDEDYSNGHGSRLKIMAPMEIGVPVQLTGDRKQASGLSLSNVDHGCVRFKKRTWSDFRLSVAGSPSDLELVFEDGFECANFIMPPTCSLTRFNGRVVGTVYSHSGTITNRFGYSGNGIVALTMYAGTVCCDVENVFYNVYGAMSMTLGDNTWVELGGYDQTILQLYIPIVQTTTNSASFGFHSPVGRPAMLRLVGNNASNPAFHGAFTGSAGLEWTPAVPREFVFSNAVQTTCGKVKVGYGTMVVRAGAGFTRLGELEVSDDSTFSVEGDAAPVRVASLVLGEHAKLSLSKADAISAAEATIGGAALTNGVYSAVELPEVIEGEGTLIVGALENHWQGGVSSDWSEGANWSRGAVPLEGEYVTIGDGASVTIASGEITPRFTSFTLAPSASITMSGWETAINADLVTIEGSVTAEGPFMTADDAPAARVRFVCDDFVLTTNGVIDVDGKGWDSCYGPGSPEDSYCGAAHGGCGGINIVGNANHRVKFGIVYDSAARPELPGSGGEYGTAGGGAVMIEASASAIVDGRILASSLSRQKDAASIGSGGSIFIDTPSFSGSGELRADGGNCSAGGARAGGGGRIAITGVRGLQEGAYEGMVISAAGGLHSGLTVGNRDKNRTESDLGTLVFGDEAIIRATLGKGLTGRLVEVSNYEHEGNLDWTSGHVRFAGDGASVSISGDLTISGEVSRLEIGGIYTRTNVGVIVDVWGGTNLNRLAVGGDLKLLGGAALDIRAAATNETMAWGGEVIVGGDMLVGSGSYLYPWCDIQNLGSSHFEVGGAFTVESNATVMADRRGGMGGRGGAGWKEYFHLKDSSERGYGLGASGSSGSSHGGLGGVGYRSYDNYRCGSPGKIVGDEQSAAYPGAGGGAGGYGEGGEGGGLVYVEAGGKVTVDGLITADGWLGSYSSLGNAKSNSGYCTYFGSGAGGGIHLKGKEFSGSGEIRARGGRAISGYADANNTYGYASGAGGGGRIYIETMHRRAHFTGITDVSGGASTFEAAAGGEGTVFYAVSGDPFGTILKLARLLNHQTPQM